MWHRLTHHTERWCYWQACPRSQNVCYNETADVNFSLAALNSGRGKACPSHLFSPCSATVWVQTSLFNDEFIYRQTVMCTLTFSCRLGLSSIAAGHARNNNTWWWTLQGSAGVTNEVCTTSWWWTLQESVGATNEACTSWWWTLQGSAGRISDGVILMKQFLCCIIKVWSFSCDSIRLFEYVSSFCDRSMP